MVTVVLGDGGGHGHSHDAIVHDAAPVSDVYGAAVEDSYHALEEAAVDPHVRQNSMEKNISSFWADMTLTILLLFL